MRYTIEAYTFRGVEHFRILDTFNGCKVLDKFATLDAATTRREQLNALQARQGIERTDGGILTVTLQRSGVKVLARYNAKARRIDTLLYSNSTQATKRAAQLRAAGVNADVWRGVGSRVFYVQILDVNKQ